MFFIRNISGFLFGDVLDYNRIGNSCVLTKTTDGLIEFKTTGIWIRKFIIIGFCNGVMVLTQGYDYFGFQSCGFYL